MFLQKLIENHSLLGITNLSNCISDFHLIVCHRYMVVIGIGTQMSINKMMWCYLLRFFRSSFILTVRKKQKKKNNSNNNKMKFAFAETCAKIKNQIPYRKIVYISFCSMHISLSLCRIHSIRVQIYVDEEQSQKKNKKTTERNKRMKITL